MNLRKDIEWVKRALLKLEIRDWQTSKRVLRGWNFIEKQRRTEEEISVMKGKNFIDDKGRPNHHQIIQG